MKRKRIAGNKPEVYNLPLANLCVEHVSCYNCNSDVFFTKLITRSLSPKNIERTNHLKVFPKKSLILTFESYK